MIIALPFTANSQKIQTITAEGKATRGENETQDEAIKRAFQDAQFKASRQVGEFVHFEEMLLECVIDEESTTDYYNFVDIVSTSVLNEITHSIVESYDHEKEAERYTVVVTFEFNTDDLKKGYCSFVEETKNQKLDILNKVILQYSRRLYILDSLLEIGESETAKYISSLSEASGLYNLISSDVEIKGGEISQIIEKQNEIYLGLIDVYIDRLENLFTNRYYLNYPIINKRTFIEDYEVRKRNRYMVKYSISWKWDNQYKQEISEVKDRIENQIPVKYQPYLLKQFQSLDRKYTNLIIVNDPEGSNKFEVYLKPTYYRIFAILRNENGLRIGKTLFRNDLAASNIETQNNLTYSNELILSRNKNKDLQYVNIKYKKNCLFTRLFGIRLEVKYDHFFNVYYERDSITFRNYYDYQYYGISPSLFINVRLYGPNQNLNSSRLRFGALANILSSTQDELDKNKLIFSIAPAFAFEFGKTSKRSFKGFGLLYSPKFYNLNEDESHPSPASSYKDTHEFQFYLLFGGLSIGATYHRSFKYDFNGFGVRLGYGIF